MLDIFKWECTINQTWQGHFPLEILHFIKNLKLALLKNLHFPTEKNITASVKLTKKGTYVL